MTAAGIPVRVADDLSALARRAAVGAVAGSLAGLVVGGVVGRLAMLVLRMRTPGAVGVTSDDGFEIGRVTLEGTVQLLVATATLGALAGAGYALARLALPRPSWLAAGLWGLLGAAVGGAGIVHADGVDFVLLDPLWFAVASFIAIPGLGALATALLVEWWERPGRRALTRRRATALAPALLGALALPFIAIGVLLAAAVRFGRWPRAAREALRIGALVAMLAAFAASAARLADQAATIL